MSAHCVCTGKMPEVVEQVQHYRVGNGLEGGLGEDKRSQSLM